MELTDKLGLKKPHPILDYVLISDINDNMDVLDEAVGELKEGSTVIEELETENKTLSGAINEVKNDLGSHKADYIHHLGFGDATGINAKVITLDPAPTSYKNGMGIAFKNDTENTGAVTINVNNLGAKAIVKSNGQPLVVGALKKDSIYTIRYNGVNFTLQGEGGEYGTALIGDVTKGKTIGTEEGIKTGTLELTGNSIASDVIKGKTFYSDDLKTKRTGSLELSGNALLTSVLAGNTFYNDDPKVKRTGTMANRGSPTNTITTQGGQYNIPAGYYSGGSVKAQFANLVAGNIKSGVNVGGIIGNMPNLPVVEHNGASTKKVLEGETSRVTMKTASNLMLMYGNEQGYTHQSLIYLGIRGVGFYSNSSYISNPSSTRATLKNMKNWLVSIYEFK